MGIETTLLLVKPDALQRGLCGEIFNRLERKGLKMLALQLMQMDDLVAGRLYKIHEGKHFYDPLVKFMTSAPIVVVVLEGQSAISVVRKLAGKTNCAEAEAGTIRGDFSMSNRYNLVHASDSPESAEREIGIFFPEKNFLRYTRLDEEFTSYPV